MKTKAIFVDIFMRSHFQSVCKYKASRHSYIFSYFLRVRCREAWKASEQSLELHKARRWNAVLLSDIEAKFIQGKVIYDVFWVASTESVPRDD